MYAFKSTCATWDNAIRFVPGRMRQFKHFHNGQQSQHNEINCINSHTNAQPAHPNNLNTTPTLNADVYHHAVAHTHPHQHANANIHTHVNVYANSLSRSVRQHQSHQRDVSQYIARDGSRSHHLSAPRVQHDYPTAIPCAVFASRLGRF